ncbi:metal-dependent hydrolase [Halobium palmae]|uniref:Metal-dependent hydrolase n=1 Tax=Halobium palmae TaxID=1776492 RepID=A0ABD5RU88_9EURY
MYPWGHLAVGYLLYSVAVHVRHRRPPTGPAALVGIGATQFPDLVDKPLNWGFNVFDGRAIGHSLVVLVPLCGLLWYWSRSRECEPLALAFAVGVLSHPLADARAALLAGDLEGASYLGWPLLQPPTYPAETAADHVERGVQATQSLAASPVTELPGSFGIQLVLFGGCLLVWASDGFPGVGVVRHWYRRWLVRRYSGP